MPIRRTCSFRCWPCAAASARSSAGSPTWRDVSICPTSFRATAVDRRRWSILSKPSYRLGAAEIRVGWKPHRLDVSVTPDRSTFRVREQARVKIHVARADGKRCRPGPKSRSRRSTRHCSNSRRIRSWDLLDAMMGQRGLEVWTSTAQIEVVGRRTFGRKAVPHGGGGGRERARELFDTLLTLARSRAARRQRQCRGDDSVERFAVELPHRRRRKRAAAIFSAPAMPRSRRHRTCCCCPACRRSCAKATAISRRLRCATPRRCRSVAAQVVAKTTPRFRGAAPPNGSTLPQARRDDIVWDVTAPVGATSLAWDVSRASRTAAPRTIA